MRLKITFVNKSKRPKNKKVFYNELDKVCEEKHLEKELEDIRSRENMEEKWINIIAINKTAKEYNR